MELDTGPSGAAPWGELSDKYTPHEWVDYALEHASYYNPGSNLEVRLLMVRNLLERTLDTYALFDNEKF
jgi:hypothetical protein